MINESISLFQTVGLADMKAVKLMNRNIRKKCKFTPFASAELYNDLENGMHFEKVRFTAGSSYQLNKHNSFELFYRYIHAPQSGSYEDRGNIIGIGYTFKL